MTEAVLTPTPNDCTLPRIRAQFATFNDAIDYAAQSRKGLNFHDMRGELARVYPYSEMRDDALVMARRLVAAGIAKEDRVALIAETGADFAALFCACVYVGAWPVPLPLPTTFGGKDNFIDQLAIQLMSSDPKILLYPEEIAEMAEAAAARQGCERKAGRISASVPRPIVSCPKPRRTISAICNIPPARPASPPGSR
jgi:fatty-acyl-CoA synthase